MPAKRSTVSRAKKASSPDSKRNRLGRHKAQPHDRHKRTPEPPRETDDAPPISPRRHRRDLQHELLLAAVAHHNGRLRFPKASAETLATTYAALRSLERKKLIEPEEASDPEIMTWKVTKAGKAAISGNQ